MTMLANISGAIGETATQLNTTSVSVEDAQQSLRAIEIFAVILMSILIILAFQGNLWIIIAILITPQLRNSMANIFIVNLCAVDLLASILAMPFSVVTFVNGPEALEKVVCEASGFFATCVMIASMLSLCVISIERFYSISLPMHHAGHATPCLYLAFVFLQWVISIGVAMLPWMGINSYSYRPEKRTCSFYWQGGNSADRAFIIVIFLLSFLVPSLILTTMYLGIFRVARKAATTVAPQPTGITVMPPTPGEVTQTANGTHNGNVQKGAVFTIATPNLAPNTTPAINVQGASPRKSGTLEACTDTHRRLSADDSGIPEDEISDKISVQSEPLDQVKHDGVDGKRNSRKVSKRKHGSKPLCACSRAEKQNQVKAISSTPSTKISDSYSRSAPARIDARNVNTQLKDQNQIPSSKSVVVPGGVGKVTPSHMKAFKTLMIIVLSYLLLWGPYFICQLHGLTHEEAASRPVEVLATWLSFTSYAVNPCLYGCMNRMIREELNHLLTSFWQCCSYCFCCAISSGHCKRRRPCQKHSASESDQEDDLDNDLDGPAESFYQFLQRTQASDVTAPVTNGNHKHSLKRERNGMTTDTNSGNISVDNQSNCMF